jgi:hypothetical protein
MLISDFLEFMRADNGHIISDNFLIYVAGYSISEIARTRPGTYFRNILTIALQQAIAQNEMSEVRLLLASGAFVNDLRYKPFEIALGQSYWAIVKLLIAAGESVTRRLFYAQGYDPMTAWEYAALLGNLHKLNSIQGTDYQVQIPIPQPPPPLGPGCVIL